MRRINNTGRLTVGVSTSPCWPRDPCSAAPPPQAWTRLLLGWRESLLQCECQRCVHTRDGHATLSSSSMRRTSGCVVVEQLVLDSKHNLALARCQHHVSRLHRYRCIRLLHDRVDCVMHNHVLVTSPHSGAHENASLGACLRARVLQKLRGGMSVAG